MRLILLRFAIFSVSCFPPAIIEYSRLNCKKLQKKKAFYFTANAFPIDFFSEKVYSI